MNWYDNLTEKGRAAVDEIVCSNDRRIRYQFVKGYWKLSPKRAQEAVRALRRRRISVRLHDLRPDIYGPNDTGPK